MPPHLRPCLTALRERLLAAFGPRLRDVVLFGSYARGQASEDSDVDVLVLVDHLEQAEIAHVATIATQEGLAFGVPLATLPLSSEHFAELRERGRPLAREIERDGARP